MIMASVWGGLLWKENQRERKMDGTGRGSKETGVGAEGCGIAAGKTMGSRWNVAQKNIHSLVFLVVGDML